MNHSFMGKEVIVTQNTGNSFLKNFPQICWYQAKDLRYSNIWRLLLNKEILGKTKKDLYTHPK